MNRRFPLATVGRVRGLQTGIARGQVAAAHAAQAHAAADVERRASTLDEHSARALPASPAGVSRALTTGVGMAGEVTVAQTLLTQRGDDVAAALDIWTAARARERAVELLAERHLARLAAEETMAEQRAADDRAGAVVAARHRAARSGALR